MADSPLVAKWQKKLDRDFPDGAVVSYQREDSPVYLVSRVECTTMAGLDPVLLLSPDSGQPMGPWQLVSLTETEPQRYTAVFAELPEPMLLNAAVPGRAAHNLSAERAHRISAAPQGGLRVLSREDA
jgi:hypothetical protein